MWLSILKGLMLADRFLQHVPKGWSTRYLQVGTIVEISNWPQPFLFLLSQGCSDQGYLDEKLLGIGEYTVYAT